MRTYQDPKVEVQGYDGTAERFVCLGIKSAFMRLTGGIHSAVEFDLFADDQGLRVLRDKLTSYLEFADHIDEARAEYETAKAASAAEPEREAVPA